MHEGITDYLEIMQLAGISELKKPREQKTVPAAPLVTVVEENIAPQMERVPVQTVPNVVAQFPTDGSKVEQLRFLANEAAK